MTNFPIAVGTGPRHSSSRPFPKIKKDAGEHGKSFGAGVGVGGDDGIGGLGGPGGPGGLGEPSSRSFDNGNDVIMAMGTDDDEHLTASVFIGYHFIPVPDADCGATNADDDKGGVADNQVDAEQDGQGSVPEECQDGEVNHQLHHSQQSHHSHQSNQSHQHPTTDTDTESPSTTPKRFNVIAELRAQITHITEPFTSTIDAVSSRETKCRVPLGIMTRINNNSTPLTQQTKVYTCNASVAFSSNLSHLACIVPFPQYYELVSSASSISSDVSKPSIPSSSSLPPSVVESTESTYAIVPTSTLVIFRIDTQAISSRQQLRQRRVLPSLPDYVVEKHVGGNVFGRDRDSYNSSTSSGGGGSSYNDKVVERNGENEILSDLSSGVGQHSNDPKSTLTRSDEKDNITLPTLNGGAHSQLDLPSSPANESPDKSTPTSPKGEHKSYVAHEPKIVRVPPSLSKFSFVGDSHHGMKANQPSSANHPEATSSHSIPRRLLQRLPSTGSNVPPERPSMPPLQYATCMCNVPFDHYRGKSSVATSMLMVGAVNGSMLLVDYSSARVNRLLVDVDAEHPEDVGNSSRSNGHSNNILSWQRTNGKIFNPIVHVAQCPPMYWKPLDIYGEEEGSESKGRISVVRRDGSVQIYTTSFVSPALISADVLGRAPLANRSGSFISEGRDANFGRIEEKTDSGLEMKVELLDVFHASDSLDSNAPGLRYVRSKWINPVLLVLLTRSPHFDEATSSGKRGRSMSIKSETVVAQIWAVAEVPHDNSAGQSATVDGTPNRDSTGQDGMSLVSELKIPCEDYDRLEDIAHGTFSLSQSTPMEENGGDIFSCDSMGQHIQWDSASIFSGYERSMCISYHRKTDCLAICSQGIVSTPISSGESKEDYCSSQLKSKPFCLIWDWKSVPGLTLISKSSSTLSPKTTGHPFMSMFHLHYDDQFGLCAVHVYDQRIAKSIFRVRKDVYNLCILSPASLDDEGLSLEQPNPLLLHSDSVSFPFLSKHLATRDFSLRWEESRVPTSYTTSNGPCKLAAVGADYGRSIAVAASCGLCILDLSRMTWCEKGILAPSNFPRWKLFSTESEEQRFRVLKMVWWERCGIGSKQSQDDTSEDLLLAVVQFSTGDSTPHLVCWSRKHLGFGENQLIKHSSEPLLGGIGAHATESNPGIRLPKGFKVQSMTILRDPVDRTNQPSTSNRALLLIAYVSCNGGHQVVKYAVYQLHAFNTPSKSSCQVLTKLAACSSIPCKLTADTVDAIFIAGGSFSFDLISVGKTRANHENVAIIAVVTIFQGLLAVSVSHSGIVFYQPSLLDFTSSNHKHTCGNNMSPIASYWLADAISNERGTTITWNVSKSDGSVFCWSIPSSSNKSNNVENSNMNEISIPPMQSSLQNGSETNHLGIDISYAGLKRFSIGDICSLGNSSLWMNGAATNENEITLGPVFPLIFNCTLFAGQTSRSIASSTFFHVGNFLVAPPSFTPSLFMYFMATISSMTDNNVSQLLADISSNNWSGFSSDANVEVERYNARSTLLGAMSLGSVYFALRIIILKVVELMNDAKGIHDYHSFVGDDAVLDINTIKKLKKWIAGKHVLYEVTCAAKDVFDGLAFAAFFLSVGRQLEPHQFDLIFPLPSCHDETRCFSSKNNLSTVEDLFSASGEYGSIAITLSALPLFPCHTTSQKRVVQLLCHCLSKIKESFSSCLAVTANLSFAEETFLHQLFWFGIKLEDAIESHEEDSSMNQGKRSISDDDATDPSKSTSTFDNDFETEDDSSHLESSSSKSSSCDSSSSESSSCEDTVESFLLADCEDEPNPFKKSQDNRKDGIVSKVVTLISSVGPQRRKDFLEEDAIHEAASSFIISGFESPLKCRQGIQTPKKSEDFSHTESCDLAESANELSEEVNNPELIRDEVASATVADLVSFFVCEAIFDRVMNCNSMTDKRNWKIVSLIANLLQGDRETSAVTFAGSTNARRISQLLTTEDFMALASAHYHSFQGDFDDNSKMLPTFLKGLSSECSNQLQSEAIDKVFNLVLLLLLRYDLSNGVKPYLTSLVVVGIVSGHLSGRAEELIDHCEGVPLDVRNFCLLCSTTL